MAVDGDIDAAIEIFSEAGLDACDAEIEALDDLKDRKPRGEFHAAKTALERLGHDRGYGRSFQQKVPPSRIVISNRNRL